MNESEELLRFAKEIQQEVLARAEAAEEGAMRSAAFTELMLEYLVDASEVDDGTACDFEGRGMRCSGWYLSEDGDRLDLFLSMPKLDGEAGTVPKAEVDTAFRRLSTFLDRALDSLFKEIEEALPRYDMCRAI